jgi:hypothetical protein
LRHGGITWLEVRRIPARNSHYLRNQYLLQGPSADECAKLKGMFSNLEERHVWPMPGNEKNFVEDDQLIARQGLAYWACLHHEGRNL